ncbi:MAG: PaaI family thioesterase [Pseudomonadota bacterium]
MDEAAAKTAFDAALANYAPGFGSFFLARLLDLRIDYPDDRCEIIFPVRDFAFNPQGSLHGGIISVILDIAQGHLIHHTYGGPGATLEMKLQYLAPVRGPSARAEGRFLRRGRSICFTTALLFDNGASEPAVVATSTWRAPRVEPGDTGGGQG